SHGFFPDFILWLVHGSKQRILFVEPHGLLMEAQSSDKLDKFHEKLAGYVNEGLSKAKLHGVSVDGWILSATPRSDLCRQWGVDWNEAEFAGRHILFPASDYDAALRAMLDIKPEAK